MDDYFLLNKKKCLQIKRENPLDDLLAVLFIFQLFTDPPAALVLTFVTEHTGKSTRVF